MSDLLNRASIYVPITSITKADEGRTRIVTGVAGTSRLDYDGERASYSWLKKELTDWFKVGNMREGHRSGGVGKALAIDFDDKAEQITVTSKAVDRDTIVKLDEGVLTGYSWGAKSVPGNPIRVRKQADGYATVESGKIVEVSYVDHPANPDCFISLVKSVGKGNRQELRTSAQLGELADLTKDLGLSQERIDWFLGDGTEKSAVGTKSQREGARFKMRDAQGKVKYPINDCSDVADAWGLRNNSSLDAGRVASYIRRAAKALNCSIPGSKTAEADLTKADGCNCCDDCGPYCGGDCCDDCTMKPNPIKALAPEAILQGVRTLAEQEDDQEYQGYLFKVADAVQQWSQTDGAQISLPTLNTLAGLVDASKLPELTKRRTFYTQTQRQAVEQAMQNLHQTLGLFMEGTAAADLDQDQRSRTLTGQDAPPVSDQPGAGPNTPGDGVAGDGNLNFDPDMVRDGDPAVRRPDGQRDGRAQNEGGVNSWPPAGDAPGRGPGDQGKGEPPGGKGKPGPDRNVAGKSTKADRKLRKQVAKTATAVQALVDKPGSEPPDVEKAIEDILAKNERRMRKLLKKAATPAKQARPDPFTEAVTRLEKAVTTTTQTPTTNPDTNLLQADLTRAAFEAVREDARQQSTWLAKRMKRAHRKLQKAAAAERTRLNKLTEGVEALGRLPRPGGPQLTAPTDKQFPVNETIERAVTPSLAKELAEWQALATSQDAVLAQGAKAHIRKLMEANGLTG